jgi:hypothetical protein
MLTWSSTKHSKSNIVTWATAEKRHLPHRGLGLCCQHFSRCHFYFLFVF